jgi:hemerythrin
MHMPLFSWKEEYSVQNAELDQHHKQFISILNGLYGKCFDVGKLEAVDNLIEELLTTVSFHFTAEENFMRERGFTGLDSHIEKHATFNSKILELKHNFRTDNLELTRELITFLGKWLLTHILKEDRQYAERSQSTLTQEVSCKDVRS